MLELRLVTRAARGEAKTVFEGGFGQLLVGAGDLPTGLARALADGVLLFGQGPTASWLADEEGPSEAFSFSFEIAARAAE